MPLVLSVQPCFFVVVVDFLPGSKKVFGWVEKIGSVG